MALHRHPRSRHWHYDVTVDGQRKRGSTRCESKMQAKAAEADVISSMKASGCAPQPLRRALTLLAYLPGFLKWVGDSQQLKATSRRYYVCGARVLSRSTLAHVPIAAIDEELIDVTVFTGQYGHSASPHLSNQALRTLRRLLTRAKKRGELHHVPAVRLREADGRSAMITHETEQKLLARLQRPEKHTKVKADREALADVFLLISDAGLRTSEALAARVENIDWAGKRLFNPGGKSKRAKRWVPLSDRLLSRLQVRCFNRAEGWVFPSTRSASGHLSSPWKGFRQARREAGVPDDILLYTGRHTFASFAVQQTGNVFAVSDAMGHQDIKSMRPYQHHDTALLGDVINKRNAARPTLSLTTTVLQ